MTASLDVAAWQERVYEPPRCWKLVTDVYLELVGQMPTEVETVSESIRRAARAFRLDLYKHNPGMHQIEEPQDLAVVLMWHTPAKKRAHCGIYWQGGVLHATETVTLFQGLADVSAVYPVMEFWAR